MESQEVSVSHRETNGGLGESFATDRSVSSLTLVSQNPRPNDDLASRAHRPDGRFLQMKGVVSMVLRA